MMMIRVIVNSMCGKMKTPCAESVILRKNKDTGREK